MQPRWCGVATSSRGTTTRFQLQPQLVPIFCDIRNARAVPTSASLEFELSLIFRRVIACCNQWGLGNGSAAHVQLLVVMPSCAVRILKKPQSSISATSARVVRPPRTGAWNALSPDDREMTACVVAPAKIGRLTSFKRVQPELFRVTRQAAQLPSLTPTILGGNGLSGVTPQQLRRCEVVPGELFQCDVRVNRRLRHRLAAFFACELVWSVQCDEQISHASALEASGLVSWQASSCKRVVCQERGRVPKTVFPWLFPCSKL